MSNSPEVVDQNGDPVVGPAMDAALKRVSTFVEIANLGKIRKTLETSQKTMESILNAQLRLQYIGVVREVVLVCLPTTKALDLFTDHDLLNLPSLPWASVTFINDGPGIAHIAVNTQEFPFTVKPGEVHPIDYINADRRCEKIFYWCDIATTASVRAKGKY